MKAGKRSSFNITSFICSIIATIMASGYNSLLVMIKNIIAKTYNTEYLYLSYILFPLILGIVIALSIWTDKKSEKNNLWILIIIINIIIIAYHLTKMMFADSSMTCLLLALYIVYFIISKRQTSD